MQYTSLSGVPVVWEQGDADYLVANLVFRSGLLYEPMYARGATAIVEQVVLASIFQSGASVSAIAEGPSICFQAMGSPTEVMASLVEVCKVLATFPLVRIPLGVARLRDGDGILESAQMRWLLHRRYGNTGLGRLGGPGTTPDQIRDETVAEHVRTHFHRDNAVLTFSGPPPAGSLPLPGGERPQRPVSVPVGIPLPAVVRALDLSAPAALLVVPATAAGLTYVTFVEKRVAAALAERDLPPAFVGGGLMVDVPDTAAFPLCIEEKDYDAALLSGTPGLEEQIAGVVLDVLRDLVDHPVAQAEIDEEVSLDAQARRERESIPGMLDMAAADLLNGVEPTRTPEKYERLVPADIQQVAVRALADLLLGLPGHPEDGAGRDVAGLPDRSHWRPADPPPVTGTVFRKGLLARRGRVRSVVVSPRGMSIVEESRTRTVLWERVAGVEDDGDLRVLHLDDGSVVTVDPEQVPRAADVVAAVDAHTAGRHWSRYPHVDWDLGGDAGH